MIVLDTNVVSELMRPSPAPEVLRWVEDQPVADIVTTVVTLAEIDYGIARLPHGQRRTELESAWALLADTWSEQILPFDRAAARRYGPLVAARDGRGRPIDVLDAQIACITLAASATLATRNVADFEETGVRVVNPWSG